MCEDGIKAGGACLLGYVELMKAYEKMDLTMRTAFEWVTKYIAVLEIEEKTMRFLTLGGGDTAAAAVEIVAVEIVAGIDLVVGVVGVVETLLIEVVSDGTGEHLESDFEEHHDCCS